MGGQVDSKTFSFSTTHVKLKKKLISVQDDPTIKFSGTIEEALLKFFKIE